MDEFPEIEQMFDWTELGAEFALRQILTVWKTRNQNQTGPQTAHFGPCTRPMNGTEESAIRRPFAFIEAIRDMAEPEITTYDRNLPEVFVGAGDLAVHVARICVLFEDLRLESSAARHTEPIELLDTTGKKYRYFYFLRRMILSLDEFSSAAQQINKSPEWKAIRETFDLETKKRWDSAVKFITKHRSEWSDLRDLIGGHFKESAARYAIDNLRATSTGKIEIVVHRDEKTAGIRFLFAEEIVASALKHALGPGQHSDEELSRYLNGLFATVLSAVNEAVKIGHTIAAAFVVQRFRQE